MKIDAYIGVGEKFSGMVIFGVIFGEILFLFEGLGV